MIAMRRLHFVLMILGASATLSMGQSYYEVPDVPTVLAPVTALPWTIARNDAGLYTLAATLPPGTPIDGLHRMGSGKWLISVSSATVLGGTTWEQSDVVAFDGVATYSLFFSGASAGVPASSDVDAVLIDKATGDLVLSFDIPTTIGATTYEPADLVRYTGGIFSLFFDASAAGIPITSNVTGADQLGTRTAMTFDVPTRVGPALFLPGQLVAWDGLALSVLDPQPGWPASRSASIDALSLLPSPGVVPPTITVNLISPTQIRIAWNGSGCAGGETYGIYEGVMGAYYSHTRLAAHCTDTPPLFQEDVAFSPGSRYYLVVPSNANVEGSYGTNSAGAERPVGAVQCVPVQELGCQ